MQRNVGDVDDHRKVLLRARGRPDGTLIRAGGHEDRDPAGGGELLAGRRAARGSRGEGVADRDEVRAVRRLSALVTHEQRRDVVAMRQVIGESVEADLANLAMSAGLVTDVDLARCGRERCGHLGVGRDDLHVGGTR